MSKKSTPDKHQWYVPPSSPEAEQSVLGAILLRPEVLDLVVDIIRPDDFYWAAHGQIFRAMLDLQEAGEPVDLVTVTQYLSDRGKLESVGGPVFLAELSEQSAFATNAESYAAIVQDKSTLRRLLDATTGISSSCFGPVENVKELVARAEERIFSLMEDRGAGEAQAFADLIPDRISHLENVWHHRGKILGVPSGFLDLDQLTGGWQPGDLILLAGRPSMGKTALALNFGTYAAQKGYPGVFFSLEMSKGQLIDRELAGESQVSVSKLRTGRLSADDWAAISHVAGVLLDTPFFLMDKATPTPLEIRAQARRLKRRHDIRWIVIDYLQLIREPRPRSREQEVAHISSSLKALAKELRVPVIALSQLNRRVEDRPNKRPTLPDLRESGALEQDADVIIFIYRDELYNEKTEEPGVAEISVAKQRNGPIGKLKLTYRAEYTRFENFADATAPAES
jgi:replicative DNA helicase